MDLKRIALHDLHLSLGAKMVPFAGYEMPIKYSSETVEHIAVRTNAGIFDVSHMGEFFIEGDEAEDFVQLLVTNDVTQLVDGQAQYACMTNEDGGVIDDLLIYRFTQKRFMLVVNASNIAEDWAWIQKHKGDFAISIDDLSSSYSLFAVQGPKAADILQTITTTNLQNIKYYHFTEGNMAGRKVIISATGYTGAGGFEIYVQNIDAEEVFKTILKAGSSSQLVPVGLGARDTLRLEMGFCLHGHELNKTITPLEAGLGWVTKLKTEFIGTEALVKQKEKGVDKKLVAFELLERGIPREGYAILNNHGVIGTVTSGTMSPILKKGIGLGFVQIDHALLGSEIIIAIRKKQIKAKIVKLPFIKK